MSIDSKASLFVLLGQTAERALSKLDEIVPKDSLLISPSYDLAMLVPDKVRRAIEASESYRLFFVFEEYLRELIGEVLSKENQQEWWSKVPKDVQDQVASLEATEEIKG